MASEFDKREWQEQQAVRDAALEKQREKEKKARERSARNARRKLERLHKTLKERGELTDWEDEFSQSVTERLDKFGSAFQDREKGRPGDALSFAQKKVISSLKAKSKGKTRSGMRRGSGFKGKAKFQPRERHLDAELPEERPANTDKPNKTQRPFLRLV